MGLKRVGHNWSDLAYTHSKNNYLWRYSNSLNFNPSVSDKNKGVSHKFWFGLTGLNCGTWVSLAFVAHRVACGILVLLPGIESMSCALEGEFLTTGPPGKSPSSPLPPPYTTPTTQLVFAVFLDPERFFTVHYKPMVLSGECILLGSVSSQ